MAGNFGARNSDLSDACANAPAKRINGFPSCHPTRAMTDVPEARPPPLPAL